LISRIGEGRTQAATRPLRSHAGPAAAARAWRRAPAGRPARYCSRRQHHSTRVPLSSLGKRCFIGNLAWRTSWQDLKDKFREAGTVVYANVMRDESGKRRGGSGWWRVKCGRESRG
jgi:hypothetical protein